jgi:hypothetical protein
MIGVFFEGNRVSLIFGRKTSPRYSRYDIIALELSDFAGTNL